MASKTIRLILCAFLVSFLFIGVCTTLAAMFTAGWQVVSVDSDLRQYQHGLYRNCIKNTIRANIISQQDWICQWKFDPSNENTPYEKLQDYHVVVMALLGLSCAFALASQTFSCLSWCCCRTASSIVCLVGCVSTTLSDVAGLIIYFRNADLNENRIFQQNNFVSEQSYGYSVHLAAAGCVLYALATLMAGIFVAVTKMNGKRSGTVGQKHVHNGVELFGGQTTRV